MLRSRRTFLLALLALSALPTAPISTWADDDGDDDGGDDDSGNGGSSGSGSSGSGSSGSGSSGSGSSGDAEDDGDDSNSGRIDTDDARDAVQSGEAMSLRDAMKRVRSRNDGRIIDVGLVRRSGRLIYEFTLVADSGRIEKLRMDAVSGRFAGLFGF